MKKHSAILLALGLYLSLTSPAAAQEGASVSASLAGSVLVAGEREGTPLMGGVGGVHLLPEPGEDELVVELRWRHRSRNTPPPLRAILLGPDRRILDRVHIRGEDRAATNEEKRTQHVRLRAPVDRRGVFALNVVFPGDRYGTGVEWSFRTNCERYIIETARGHKDQAHEEPIVLRDPGEPADVWFRPRQGRIELEAEELPDSVSEVSVRDARGREIETITAEDGRATGAIAADQGDRDAAPWRIHLPAGRATLHIDGVTRWSGSDAYRDMCYWTDSADAWFALHRYRWLVRPYKRLIHGEPGETRQQTFEIRNNGPDPRTIKLSLEYPGEPWPARLSQKKLQLDGQSTGEVTVEFAVPEGEESRRLHLRATPVEDEARFSTYATIEARAGRAPARDPLEMPLTLEPYRHENTQFGYRPDYPTDWEKYFDLENRPSVRVSRGIRTLRSGQWELTDFSEAVRSETEAFENTRFGLGTSDTKIAYDAENDMYIAARTGGRAALLHSTDGGRSFTAYDLGRSGALDIEQFSGNNAPEHPPAVVRAVQTERDDELKWRRLADLELIPIEKDDGGPNVGEPILLTEKALGVGSHSGVPSAVVSRGSKIHVIWGEATDPDRDVPGVPTYVVTYDRESGKLAGDPVLIGYGPPPNDTHNRPSITMDGEGYLHALTGTHGRPFRYARSKEPNNAHAGWTDAEPLGEDVRQTYVGLVCDDEGTLHVAYRLSRYDEQPHPDTHHATLAYQRKRPGEPWEPPRILVTAAMPDYSIFYHRLTIDRRGRLMLSYDYWSTYWFYRNDHPGRRGNHRNTIFSPDGGDTWQLLHTSDLQ